MEGMGKAGRSGHSKKVLPEHNEPARRALRVQAMGLTPDAAGYAGKGAHISRVSDPDRHRPMA
jgi:hypothetical protein